ncbi:MAG TPA: zinc dependent phospholipase C family protein [Bryobacterales bacterium]|nr:zinc dependent phospholipase C family protein [Bryobacterales bacterium]
MKRVRVPSVVAIPLLVLFLSSIAPGYSVLTHEAVIDSSWEPNIRRLLLARFPTATQEQLREAHAYAYGGSVIQDMGYYPFGSHFFSDLAHYVRSGDFIQALLEDSQDLNEYAFALGALEHYIADNEGHPLAVNRAVPIVYPELGAKYGKVVTYAQDPKAHLLVEFSFDVVQIAGSGYLPETYHDFIGFKVAKPLLDRAFQKTYGLELKDLFVSEDLAIGTYRRGASEVIPEMTKIAWQKRRNEIKALRPGIRRARFIYKLSRRDYETDWGGNYKNPKASIKRWGEQVSNPGFFAKLLVFLYRIFPKVGRFRTLSFRLPTPHTQALFTESVKAAVVSYQDLLGNVQRGHLRLANEDFDTGKPTRAGEYELADETYAKLLDRLARKNFTGVTPELRTNILAFYSDLSLPIATKKDRDLWEKTLRNLDKLKAAPIQTAQSEQP